MDEERLKVLQENVMLALRKAEAVFHASRVLDITVLLSRVQEFKSYVEGNMPPTPSESLKQNVHEVLWQVTQFSDRLSAEIEISKRTLSSAKQTDKLNKAYSYGARR